MDRRRQKTTKRAITPRQRSIYIQMYLTKSRPDISAAVSFGATKAIDPNARDQQNLLYIVEYLRKTAKQGHRIYAFSDQPWQLYCTVDASYLLHPDSKGHTGYTLGLFREGTFYNRSAKQALVSTSSTHAEMRAIFYTLVKDIIFISPLATSFNSISKCQRLSWRIIPQLSQ